MTRAAEPLPPARERVVSVDALRGFDMFWIVGGQELALAVARLFADPLPPAVARQFEHVEWEGFAAWDLIMPLFLFVVGVAMPFSIARRQDEGESTRQLHWKIVRRSLTLFVLGMAVQGNLLDFNPSTLHIYCNTLQAIAAGYFVSALLLLHARLAAQLAVAAAMLVGFWALLMFVPVPGQGAGVLLPEANLPLSVDEFVLGRFRDGTSYTWVLSSMTFAASVLLGVFAGHVLRSTKPAGWKLAALVTMGICSLGAGWAWAAWGGLPIIKHVWTSSMTLWAAGWSYLLLALFYLLIDIWKWQRWAFPFVVIGMNAITIYVAYHFIPFRTIAEGLVGGLASHLGRGGPALIELTTVALVWLPLYHMYRQRIFLRI
jgi:predicted acyltransferase